MILRIRNRVGIGLAVALLGVSCGDAGGHGPAEGPLVITTTSIWGDIVAEIAGPHAVVEVLIPRGADPHDYQPSSRQVARLRDAAVVFANGLGLEEGLTDVLEAATGDGVVVVQLGDLIESRTIAGSNRPDPHFWTDPNLVRDALTGIVDGLSRTIDLPPETWTGAADELAAELEELDMSLRSMLSVISRRKLVTTHESIEYFAAAYDFDVIGVAVPGGSTLASPSAADLGRLIDLIESEGVPAILVDGGQFEDLAESIAESAKVEVVAINASSLGEAGTATGSYLGMMLELGETLRDRLG